MMIRATLLGLVGVASFAGVYALMLEPDTQAPLALPPPALEAPAPSQTAAAASTEVELRPGPPPADTVASLTVDPARIVRDVTPSNMTAGPRVTSAIARIVPPAPPQPQEKARHERLFNPLVVTAGTIKVRNREISLAGIEAPAFQARCGEGAGAWPCGRMARAALRSFIRGRAVECEVPAGADDIPDPASCAVGGDDISEWLVAQGWAKPKGGAFETAGKTARAEKLGLWGDARPDDARPDVQESELAAGG